MEWVGIRAKMRELAIALVLFVVILVPFLVGLEQEVYHGDESPHISRGIKAIELIVRGEIGGDAWGYFGFIWPANVIMGVGPWLIGVRSGGWVYNVRPPDQVLLSARVMVAILGALTCVILFYLGRKLDFKTGLFALLLLAFNPLWLMISRQAMRDAPSAFFSTISILLFYYSTKRRGFKVRASLFALSGMTAGLAVSSKELAGLVFLTIAIYLILTILNKYYVERAIDRASVSGLFIFTILSILAFIASRPYVWPDPYRRTFPSWLIPFLKFGGLENSWERLYYGPWVPGDRLAAASGIIHCILWPVYKATPLRHFPNCLTWYDPAASGWGWGAWPSTFSTLPGTVFFLIGLAYLASRGANKQLSRIETLTLLWFIITFAGLSLWTPILWARYFTQLIPPMVLVEAYGLRALLRGMSGKTPYLFTGMALTSHVGSVLIGFPGYYHFSLHSVFANDIGLTLTTVFIISILCIIIPRTYSIFRRTTSLQAPKLDWGRKEKIVAAVAMLAVILTLANMYSLYNVFREVETIHSGIESLDKSIDRIIREEIEKITGLSTEFKEISTSEMLIRGSDSPFASAGPETVSFWDDGDMAIFNVSTPRDASYLLEIFARSDVGPGKNGSALEIVIDDESLGIVFFTAAEWRWIQLGIYQIHAGSHEIKLINRESPETPNLGDTNIAFTKVRISWLRMLED